MIGIDRTEDCCTLLKRSIRALWKCHNICCRFSKITLQKLKLAYHWTVEHHLEIGSRWLSVFAGTKQLIIRWNSTVVCYQCQHKWLYLDNATPQEYYHSLGCICRWSIVSHWTLWCVTLCRRKQLKFNIEKHTRYMWS